VGYGRCLTDKPGKNNLLQDTEFQQPPGQLYPVKRECEFGVWAQFQNFSPFHARGAGAGGVSMVP
ncbi:hypothetical protein JTE90_001299, partial [Oedothorax gibbosus]